MRLLVTGAAGFLGRHVCQQGVAAGMTVVGTYRSRPAPISGVEWHALDVTDAAAVDALIGAVEPNALVHTAAAVAGSLTPLPAERNWPTNAHGPLHVARACVGHAVRLVHISSDAVHRGRDEPYDDETPPDPISPYGAAKAAAELAVAFVAPDAAVVRVPPIMGNGKDPNGLARHERFMLDVAAGRASGVLFTDEVRCPIAVGDLAAACVELACNDVAGQLNLAGSDAMSWYDMGRLVVAGHGGDPDALPAGTHQAAGVARPGRVVLDTSRAQAVLKTSLRGLHELYGRSTRSLEGRSNVGG